jgi:hypothetical protein
MAAINVINMLDVGCCGSHGGDFVHRRCANDRYDVVAP